MKDPLIYITLILVPLVFTIDIYITWQSYKTKCDLNTWYYNLFKKQRLFKVIIWKILICSFLVYGIINYIAFTRYYDLFIIWVYFSHVIIMVIKYIKYKK